MKTLKEYKRLQADAQRAQVKYNNAIVTLKKEADQARKKAEDAGAAWRAHPSDKNRQKMLQTRKLWAARLKMLETLLGHLHVG